MLFSPSFEVIHLFSPSFKSTPNPNSPIVFVSAEWFLEPRCSPGALISFGSAGWKYFSLGGSCSPAFVFRLSCEEHESWPHSVTRNICCCFFLLWLTWFNQLRVWFMESPDAKSCYWVFEEMMETNYRPSWRIFMVHCQAPLCWGHSLITHWNESAGSTL